MPLHSPEGLKESPRAPLLVNTPGMFDQQEALADCALKFLGKFFSLQLIVCSLMYLFVEHKTKEFVHCCLGDADCMRSCLVKVCRLSPVCGLQCKHSEALGTAI